MAGVTRIRPGKDHIKINNQWLPKQQVQRFASRETLATQARIQQNVQAGKDATGGDLKTYAPAYVDAIKAGRVRKPGGPRKVSIQTNLTISGDLLGSMHVFPFRENSTIGAIINFVGGHYSGMRTKKLAQALEKMGFRKWFGFGKKDIKRISDKYDKLLMKHLKDLVE